MVIFHSVISYFYARVVIRGNIFLTMLEADVIFSAGMSSLTAGHTHKYI